MANPQNQHVKEAAEGLREGAESQRLFSLPYVGLAPACVAVAH